MLTGFQCPDCGRASIQIDHSIELGADARSDEITLQTIHCPACSFRGVAVYQESRRGALDEECQEHIGYRASAADLALLEQLLAACPRPRETGCPCTTHRELQQCDASGCWNALATRGLERGFAMQRSP